MLTKRAAATGRTKSDLIRQAIDALLEQRDDDAQELARFKAAMKYIAQHPLSLPDGRTYVKQLRAADNETERRLERRRA